MPAGRLFLMGDNRDRSADSRFPLGAPINGLGGAVPFENIGGRAEFITFSLDGTTSLFNPASWFGSFRSGRAGTSLRGSPAPAEQQMSEPSGSVVATGDPDAGTATSSSPARPKSATRGLTAEVKRAAIWIGMALLVVLVVWLAQPIMLIIGGLVFAVILDGGTRLLGRVLPIGRGWRLAIVTLAGFAFIGWTFFYAGTTLAGQAEQLRAVVTAQSERLTDYLRADRADAQAATCRRSAASCSAGSGG